MYSPYFWVKNRYGNFALKVWFMLYIITVAFHLASLNVVDRKCYIFYKKFLLNHPRTIIIRIEQRLLHLTLYTTIVCQIHRPNYLQSITTQCMQSACKNIYSISKVDKEDIRLLERVYSTKNIYRHCTKLRVISWILKPFQTT